LVGSQKAAENFQDLDCYVPASLKRPGPLFKSKLLWPQLVASQFLKAAKTNRKPFVFHGLSNLDLPLGPLGLMGMRRVVTIHDLIPLLAPRGVSAAYRTQFRLALPFVLRSADAVVCVSDWTRRTIEERFPAYAEKLVVIKNGLASRAPRIKAKSVGDVIEGLCVSRHESYKRLDFLLEVLKEGKGRLALTVVTDERGTRALAKSGADFVQRGLLKLHANLDQASLAALYEAADVYVHPSLFEGFCLPAAEALQTGTPIVYQAGSGIDEVCGSTVAFPLSEGTPPAAWWEAIEQAVTLGQSEAFSELVKAHLATLATWKDAATSLKSLYNELI
jgi:glycosyltransferase involved in cell wall biosynthesis